MKKIMGLCCLLMGFCSIGFAQGFRKYDSTMKLGKPGYRIRCANKNPLKNSLTVSPIGFENSVKEVDLDVKGRVLKCEMDDLNNDGYPDILIYLYDTANKGNVFGIASEKGERLQVIIFPDIADDVKLKEGYNGNDEYQLLQGTLLRKFPLYKKTDNGWEPTGMQRVVQYKVTMGDKAMLKFAVLRSFDKEIAKK